ncbi:MAG TPA: CBS domain-containing protein [Terriglobales bacterium]|nr:CBS domain-containing protein [Terriglobales bacterium]
MKILDVCDHQTATVSLEATVAQAIEAMISAQVGAVAVTDHTGRIRGIFTERDVLLKIALSGANPCITPVSKLMTCPVQTAIPDITPIEALGIMAHGHFRHLPIVDLEGKLLGMLSMRNLLEWRTKDLDHELDALEQYFANDSLGG